MRPYAQYIVIRDLRTHEYRLIGSTVEVASTQGAEVMFCDGSWLDLQAQTSNIVPDAEIKPLQPRDKDYVEPQELLNRPPAGVKVTTLIIAQNGDFVSQSSDGSVSVTSRNGEFRIGALNTGSEPIRIGDNNVQRGPGIQIGDGNVQIHRF